MTMDYPRPLTDLVQAQALYHRDDEVASTKWLSVAMLVRGRTASLRARLSKYACWKVRGVTFALPRPHRANSGIKFGPVDRCLHQTPSSFGTRQRSAIN